MEEKLAQSDDGGGENGRRMVHISVEGDDGYVWSAADAAWMQREMRIVGADVGGQRRGRGQGSERGLPVQLMAEEVAVLLEAGVARVQPARGWGAGPSAPGVERATGAAAAPDQGGSWQSALPGDGERFSVPAAAPDPPTATGEGQVWEWTFPSTPRERDLLAVFRDLHRRGMRLVPGRQFGGDFLAYEDDPSRVHASFVVAVVGRGDPLLPSSLAARARAAHGALKHLLLAWVERGEGGGVAYVSVEPPLGFQGAERRRAVRAQQMQRAQGTGQQSAGQSAGQSAEVRAASPDSEGEGAGEAVGSDDDSAAS